MGHLFVRLRTNKLSTTIIIIMETALLISGSVFCAAAIVNSRVGIKRSIQQRMLDIANCAAGSVNGDLLETLTADDEDTPAYRNVYDALAVFRDNVELEYVYGIRDEGDGRFTFTVDPTLDDPGVFGSEVHRTEALVAASRGTATVDEVPYKDSWGEFYSAYSPVYDSSGSVAGIIAADFSVSWFESQLENQTHATILQYCIIMAVTLLVVAALSLVVVTPFVRQQERLSAELNKKANENEQLVLQVIRSLADAVDAKDNYTVNHSRRVSQYATTLAKALGWDSGRVRDLRQAALLHDIGMIGVPDSILSSPRNLTEVEYGIIKSHTMMGGDILSNGSQATMYEDVARSHHERYDGSGYPNGLKGASIPEEARVVAIADAFDAMNSNRAYRQAYDREHIRRELLEGKGSQFDPGFVDVFMDLWDQGSFDSILENRPSDGGEDTEDSTVLLHELVEAFIAQSAAEEIDITTGIMNRTAGEAVIARVMQEVSGCLAFFDVDNLKKINDTSGHEAGDRVLKLMGKTLMDNSEDGLYCRLGGDEFLLFMKEVSKNEAEERVRRIMRDFVKAKNDDVEICVATLSAGLMMSTPSDSYANAYRAADRALYHVKQEGKDGYSFYDKEYEASVYEHVDVNRLVSGIRNSGGYQGALEVEYREFVELYEYISNLEQRFAHPFKLLLITLETAGNVNVGTEELEEGMSSLEQSIRQTIRNVDILTRYGKRHFLVILVGTDDEGATIAVNRLCRDYYKLSGSDTFSVSYYLAGTDGRAHHVAK